MRDHLLSTAPRAFFVTDHDRGYPAVLVELATVDAQQLADLLEGAWRRAAPAPLVRHYDQQQDRPSW